MPTRTQIILCWALFTGAMTALGWILHRTVPPAMNAAYGAIGLWPVLGGLAVIWAIAAYVGWGPSVRAAIARRREAAVRQRQ